MRVGLYRGTGFVSCAIKWQTRNQYSHAALIFSDDVLIEATWPKVRKRGVDYSENFDLFEVQGCTPADEAVIRAFAEAQIGKPYDLTMVLRFVTREQESRASVGKWFCSELAFAAIQKRIPLLNNIEPWAVSPALLSLSPCLKRINGGRFTETWPDPHEAQEAAVPAKA